MEACDYGSLQSLLETQLTENTVQFTENTVQFTENTVQFTEKTAQFTEKTAQFNENTVQFTENTVREILSCVLLGLESLRSVFIIHGVLFPPCCNGVEHQPRLSLPLPARRGQNWLV